MAYCVDTKKLKIAMINKDIATITELSEKTGVDRNTLSSVVNGKSLPSVNVMYKISEGLELNPNDAGDIFFAQDLRNT